MRDDPVVTPFGELNEMRVRDGRSKPLDCRCWHGVVSPSPRDHSRDLHLRGDRREVRSRLSNLREKVAAVAKEIESHDGKTPDRQAGFKYSINRPSGRYRRQSSWRLRPNRIGQHNAANTLSVRRRRMQSDSSRVRMSYKDARLPTKLSNNEGNQGGVFGKGQRANNPTGPAATRQIDRGHNAPLCELQDRRSIEVGMDHRTGQQQ